MQIMKHLITTVGEPKMKGGGEWEGGVERSRWFGQQDKKVAGGRGEGRGRRSKEETRKGTRGATDGIRKGKGGRERQREGGGRGEVRRQPHSDPFVWYVLLLTETLARIAAYANWGSPGEFRLTSYHSDGKWKTNEAYGKHLSSAAVRSHLMYMKVKSHPQFVKAKRMFVWVC